MNIEARIEEVLNKIRPFLNSDGGDVEFIKFENGTVYVKLVGACSHCPLATETLKTTIEGTLTSEIKEVIKVVNVNN
ncbi:MAG: NifU family protein [Bacilli bacterium]|jgi:Fe-S cluster biogenesis protein NfuA|nr:NifU family protein [Bacilli bacterium]